MIDSWENCAIQNAAIYYYTYVAGAREVGLSGFSRWVKITGLGDQVISILHLHDDANLREILESQQRLCPCGTCEVERRKDARG